jgi:hypothetical protein
MPIKTDASEPNSREADSASCACHKSKFHTLPSTLEITLNGNARKARMIMSTSRMAYAALDVPVMIQKKTPSDRKANLDKRFRWSVMSLFVCWWWQFIAISLSDVNSQGDGRHNST